MTLEEIKLGENSHLEFKREIPEKKESVLKSVSAFSNTSGGKIVFGVDDKNFDVIGINGDVFKLMDGIINSISDNLEPMVSPAISTETIDGKTVIVLEVFPTNFTPVFLKAKGKDLGTFIRVGATSRPADYYALKELELNGSRTSFDSLKCVSFMNDANSFNKEAVATLCADINRYIKEKEIDSPKVTEKTLESFGVLKNINGDIQPTNAFALLTKPDRFEFINAGIRCACFKGTDKSVFIDKLDCEGPVYIQIEQALKFIKRNIRVGIEFKGVQGIDSYEIPLTALRESIVNAVAHRNYMIQENIRISIFDDRLEIISPGTLPPGLSLESALQGKSLSRNPVLAKVLRLMGIMEEWGSGFRRINADCSALSIPLPVYKETEISFDTVFNRVFAYGVSVSSDKLATSSDKWRQVAISGDKTSEEKILDYIRENKTITAVKAQQITGLSPSGARKVLNLLCSDEHGNLEPVGKNKNRYYRLKK
ncbi:MAG: putative DNA binding domain-containing protein [Spirochaetaceae bacterium]|nr:putative DNA binding domain-containing protein [Spirochaetaceae bacterium]